MHYVKANGASIPAIGLGTFLLEGADCVTMVREALVRGYRHIDTARMYGNEAEVGEGLRQAGLPRDEVFVTTKVWWTDLGAEDLRRSAEGSLQRLGLDQLDLLLVHWPNPAIPLAETMAALARVKQDGLARHIGISNFTTRHVAQALETCPETLVANQVEYHPYLDQSKVHAACRKAGMAMVSYCPLHRDGGLLGNEVVRVAAAHHGKTPGQIVLRWHVQQDGVVAIPRTSKPERLSENADIFDFELTGDEMAAISGLAGKGSRLCDFDFSPDWDA
ncbi:MAG: aldo/keto reductase [Rhizobiaceae bacterium]